MFFDFLSVEFYLIIIISIFNAFLINMCLNRGFVALQLGEYKNKSYFEYFKDTFYQYFGRIVFICALSLCFSIFVCLIFGVLEITLYLTFVSIVAYIYYVLDFIDKDKTREKRTELKFTKRFLRIYVLNLILNFIISYFLLVISVNYIDYLMYGMVCLTLPLAFFVLPLSNLILKPCEILIKINFKRKAKKKLSSYPNLVKIAITGSYGKTSTKFILKTILSEKYNVCASPSSYNTPMGLTKTILNNLEPYHDIFIAEMGANVKNDIKELCDLVNPSIGIITAVGNSHLKTFKTMENLKKTKFQLVESVQSLNGLMVFNADNETACDFYKMATCIKLSTSTVNFNADTFAMDIIINESGTSFTLHTKKGFCKCSTRLVGRHNIENILLAVSVAIELNLTLKEIQKAIQLLEPISHRLELKKQDNYYILDDSFNSNAVGAKNALEVLSYFKGKKIVVTPGIVELGDDAFEENLKFAKRVARIADVCIVVNKVNELAFKQGLEDKIKCYYAKNFNNAIYYLREELEKDACVLFENDLPDNFI